MEIGAGDGRWELELILAEYHELQAEKRLVMQGLVSSAAILGAGGAALLTQITPSNVIPIVGFGPLILFGVWLVGGLLGYAEIVQDYLVAMEARVDRGGERVLSWERTKRARIPNLLGIVRSWQLAALGLGFGALAMLLGVSAIAWTGKGDVPLLSLLYVLFCVAGAAGIFTLFRVKREPVPETSSRPEAATQDPEPADGE